MSRANGKDRELQEAQTSTRLQAHVRRLLRVNATCSSVGRVHAAQVGIISGKRTINNALRTRICNKNWVAFVEKVDK